MNMICSKGNVDEYKECQCYNRLLLDDYTNNLVDHPG